MQEIETKMERDSLISLFFNLTYQALMCNDELADKTKNQYSMKEIQKIVTSIVITKDRRGLIGNNEQPLEKEGYPIQFQTGAPTPQETYNPPWPKFSGQQLSCPPGWDGTELCQAPSHKGEPWVSLEKGTLDAYVRNNDDSKYHNKARWEIERRIRDNVEEPMTQQESDLPF